MSDCNYQNACYNLPERLNPTKSANNKTEVKKYDGTVIENKIWDGHKFCAKYINGTDWKY